MARLIELESVKTYATQANAIKAVEAKYPAASSDGLHYFIHTTPEGRYFPVFVGERAIKAGVHFNFNVVG